VLIKLILQIRNSEETQNFISQEYEKVLKLFILYNQKIFKALKTYATKKDIFYTNEFFKQFIKNNFTIALPLLNSLISFSNLTEDGGSKDDFKRSFVIIY
jgi:hypothetical protein